MKSRTTRFLAAAAGLAIAAAAHAQEPPPFSMERGRPVAPPRQVSTNQQTANTIAEHLRQSGQLHNYRIDVQYQDGLAELTGKVADQPQREEALRIALGVPGVERVHDHLTLANAAPVTQVKAVQPPAAEEGPLLVDAAAGPVLGPAPTPAPADAAPALQEPPPLSPRTTESATTPPPKEPLPIFQAPRPQVYDLNPPKMPPYAWPTYAPYNNYSRVAYPTLYPYQSWPYIGPMYPFPKVPLGWRSVTLKWQDGHWWYGKNATGHQWWHLRYW